MVDDQISRPIMRHKFVKRSSIKNIFHEPFHKNLLLSSRERKLLKSFEGFESVGLIFFCLDRNKRLIQFFTHFLIELCFLNLTKNMMKHNILRLLETEAENWCSYFFFISLYYS